MANLTPTPGWDPVPQLEINTKALGGAGGPANSQAQALLDRTELIAQGTATAASAITGAEVVSVSQLNSGTKGIVATTLTSILTWLKTTLMTRSNNLSDVSSVSTARTNLGLGTVATLNTVPIANGGTGQTAAGGATIDAISGFSGTGYLQRTGVGTYAFNAAPYTLPNTTTTTLGGMITGAGLTVASGTVSVAGVATKSLTGASSGVTSYRTNPDGSIEIWGLTNLGVGVNTVAVTLPVALTNGIIGWATSDTGTSCFSFGITVTDSTHINVLAPAYWINSSGTVAARANATCAWHIVGF